MIKTQSGKPIVPLGLAAHPEQDPRCVRRAFERGINYFFFYGPGQAQFIEGLKPLLVEYREDVIVATGSGARKRSTLAAARRKVTTALGAEALDVFFAEYVHPGDEVDSVFGTDGVLDELQQWKADGLTRYVGASAHDRGLARQLAEDGRVDLLMHRYNMAHRKAAREVFPAALEARTPVVAFTATRWGTLLESRDDWSGTPPSAGECYRYCLAHAAIKVVLTAPRTLQELEENLSILEVSRMTKREAARWEQFGDLVYGDGNDRFETQWA